MTVPPRTHERVAVIGGGAIGAIVAAHLVRAGTPVTLVEARDDHREAMRTAGVRLTGVSDFVAHPQVLSPAELEGPIETALVAVKCPQTSDALDLVDRRLAPSGIAVSLQNGFELYRFADVLGRDRAIGAVVTLSGYVQEPGLIVHTGIGGLALGQLTESRSSAVSALSALLRAVCPTDPVEDIRPALWSKAAISAVWFATALVDEDVVAIISHRDYLDMLAALAAEVAVTARGEGIECLPVDGFDSAAFLAPEAKQAQAESWERHRAFWMSVGQTRTGVWRDLAIHHRPTEVGCILSPILDFAARQKREVPRLRRLISLVSDVEAGSRSLSWENLDDLRSVHRAADAVAP